MRQMPKKKSLSKKKPKRQDDQAARPPIVVVLGHIDHGKTTLLDYIRKTRIAVKEAGGITQRIGAYLWSDKTGRRIAFIDTPGHEAFAKMRARGAQVADVAILVVAADDGVMPQTKEAIAHAKVAKIPIVVAINKIDAKGADPKKVKGQLVKEGVVPEDQGGDTPVVAVSAKTGQGVPELLEMVGLVADLLELKAKPKAPLSGVVVESTLSPQQGPLATLIVKEGTLRVGDEIWAEGIEGKTKALFDDRGKGVEMAMPGMPVGALGFSKVPVVGAEVSSERIEEGKKVPTAAPSKLKPQDTDLSVVLRCDTRGSLEAVSGTLLGLRIDEKGMDILLAGIGQITDSDIYLAQSAGGVVLGFNVKSAPSAKRLAEDLGVGMRSFTIIYELLEVAENLLRGVGELAKAKIRGEGEVIKTFALHSGDVVLGVEITAGKITYRDKVRVLRDEEEVHRGQVRGLKIGRSEVPEAKEGDKAGVLVKPQFEFKKGDKIAVL